MPTESAAMVQIKATSDYDKSTSKYRAAIHVNDGVVWSTEPTYDSSYAAMMAAMNQLRRGFFYMLNGQPVGDAIDAGVNDG